MDTALSLIGRGARTALTVWKVRIEQWLRKWINLPRGVIPNCAGDKTPELSASALLSTFDNRTFGEKVQEYPEMVNEFDPNSLIWIRPTRIRIMRKDLLRKTFLVPASNSLTHKRPKSISKLHVSLSSSLSFRQFVPVFAAIFASIYPLPASAITFLWEGEKETPLKMGHPKLPIKPNLNSIDRGSGLGVFE